MIKLAYPQPIPTHPPAPHNINKWVQAAEEIYGLMSKQPYPQAFGSVTQHWDKNEILDFKNWLGFYQEQADQKYKIAQFNPLPPYALKANVPNLPIKEEDPKEIIEKFIKSIMSRLTSAERLATSNSLVRTELQQRLGNGLGPWLEALHSLKRQLQTMKIRQSSLIQDLMIREANILKRNGFAPASQLMLKIAQEVPTQPAEPAEEDEALKELIQGMNFEDVNEIMDPEDDPMSDIKILAQEIPPQALPVESGQQGPAESIEPTMAPEVPMVEPEIEVESPEAETVIHQKTDDLFDAALDNISIHDVIARLEVLANLFRTREIPRQLAIIDLMMDKLNISAFFPSLAEANSKSLESNQYALTRVEEILSKLRGTVRTPKDKELDLTGVPQPEPNRTPVDNEAVRQQLAQKMDQEKARKERRKQQEEQAEQELMAPEPAITPNTPVPAPQTNQAVAPPA